MTQNEFEDFLMSLGSSVRYKRDLIKSGLSEKVLVKGYDQIGEIDGVSHNYFQIKFPDDECVFIPYIEVFFIDDHGQPIVPLIKDQLGQTVALGNHVVYSSFNEIEIGRVDKITDAGNLMVTPIRTPKRQRLRKVEPRKSIRMPVSDSVWTYSLLSDFKNIKETWR